MDVGVSGACGGVGGACQNPLPTPWTRPLPTPQKSGVGGEGGVAVNVELRPWPGPDLNWWSIQPCAHDSPTRDYIA